MILDGHVYLKVILRRVFSLVACDMKPLGSHFASLPFKHKLYCKRASYVSISLAHRLLLTILFYFVLLNILECIKIAETH